MQDDLFFHKLMLGFLKIVVLWYTDYTDNPEFILIFFAQTCEESAHLPSLKISQDCCFF